MCASSATVRRRRCFSGHSAKPPAPASGCGRRGSVTSSGGSSGKGLRSRAQAYADTGLSVFAETRHRYGVAYCRKLLGEIYFADGRLNDASRTGEALDTFQNCGDPWIEAETSRLLAKVRASQDRSRDAVRLLDKSATAFADLDDFPSLGIVQQERAASRRRRARDDWNALQSRVGAHRAAPQ